MEVAPWLISMQLGEYIDGFLANGYDDLSVIKEEGLRVKDFDIIGITKEGHRQKIRSQIKQL